MFESARLQLTAWYLVVIMVVSGVFSVAFYHSSTREIQRLINRIELDQRLEDHGLPVRVSPPLPRNAPSLEELKELKQRSLFTLLLVNVLILVCAGGAGYFLAGRTLRPIKQMMEEQNDFISNASHELRTPLAVLRAELEGALLEKRLGDVRARSVLQSNLEEVMTLQELTNNLLRLTQLTHLAKSQLGPTSLLQIVTAAKKKVTTLAVQKQQKITMEMPDVTIGASTAELIEALVILLDNAIKYSPVKSTIRITARKTNKSVTLSITDQGVGIAKSDLPHIFQRFYRADKSRSQAEGYGLGLSIAKKIIEAHRGSISVRSQVGEGTTMNITLPVIRTVR
jgi:two-component system sensor histidine kinase CiaH